MIPERRPEFEPLRETLRRRRTTAFITDAQIIRDHADVSQRDEEARRYLREAMLLYATGRISAEQRDRVLDILSFATLTEQQDEADRADPADDDLPARR